MEQKRQRIPQETWLIEIDYYGDALVGCLGCNRWGKPDDQNLVMELMEENLEALRQRAKLP